MSSALVLGSELIGALDRAPVRFGWVARVDVASRFVRWQSVWAFAHRGYWLVTSLYLVIDAKLSPLQLVFIGTAQSIVGLVCEVPAGVVADAISRRRSLVIAHLLMGVAMIATGLVTSFALLVATQMLWGLAWCFASGADVAWITDELNDRERIDSVLARSARSVAVGSALGIVAFGLLAWGIGRGPAIVCSGALTFVLVAYPLTFPEANFRRTQHNTRRGSFTIAQGSIDLARRDSEVRAVFVTSFLVAGGAETFVRLYAKRLVDLGFPTRSSSIAWYTVVSLLTLLVAAIGLRVVERRIGRVNVARRTYAVACATGAVALLALAVTRNVTVAAFAAVIVGAMAANLTRTTGAIWLNQRTSNEIRATVHSFRAQCADLGEITCSFALGVIAQRNLSAALLGAAALLGLAAMVSHTRRGGVTATGGPR